MKVDFHFHLEEGPYSSRWVQRTACALEKVHMAMISTGKHSHTLAWAEQLVGILKQRMDQGCFHETWLETYFELGKQRGIERFGLVDHGYRFTEFRDYYEKHLILDHTPVGKMQQYWLDRVCIGSIEPFIAAVKKAQQAGYPVSLGLEADYFPGGEQELGGLLSKYDLDYVIGSVHFLDGWGFDNPETEDVFKEKDLPQLYRHFFDTVSGAVASGLFDMIAHLDNLKVFNYRPDESVLLPMYENIAVALKTANVATELNTGLAYRYPVKEACPSPSFLQVLKKHEVPMTLSSDSHFPDDIGMLLDEAIELLKHVGYKEIVYFKDRQRIVVPL